MTAPVPEAREFLKGIGLLEMSKGIPFPVAKGIASDDLGPAGGGGKAALRQPPVLPAPHAVEEDGPVWPVFVWFWPGEQGENNQEAPRGSGADLPSESREDP